MALLRNITILLLIASMLVLCTKEQTEVVEPKAYKIDRAEKILLEKSNQLGYSYFSGLSESQSVKRNLIVSPINAMMAFNIMLQAAESSTYIQIKQFLRLEGLKDSNIIEGFDKINSLFSEIDENTKLVTTNSLATQPQIEIEKALMQFANKRGYINIIQDEKAGFINYNLPGNKQFDDFQLINTFGFNGQIQYQKRIEELPFYKRPGESSFIKMIVAESEFNYYSDLTVQAVDLPLGRGNFNMLIIVPQGQQNIEELALKLDERLLRRIKGKCKPHALEVFLPLLDISGIETFTSVLLKSRIYNCFNAQRADFKKLSESTPLHISDFEQVVNFSLNNSSQQLSNLVQKTLTDKTTLLIDHPFLFVVYEKYSDAVMLLGKIVEL